MTAMEREFTGNPKVHYSENELLTILKNHNVLWQKWETQGFRSIADLLDLLNNHQAALIYFPDKSLQMSIHVAVIIIQFQLPDKRILELEEDRQEIIGTNNILKRHVRGIGETVRNKERPYYTAIRGLKEELGFSDPNLFRLSSTVIRSEWTDLIPSKKWPGLYASYYRRTFGCFINPDLYRPEGYIKTKSDVRIIFAWRPTEHLVMTDINPF